MATGLQIQENKITLITADKNFTEQELNEANISIIKRYGTKEDLNRFIKLLNNGQKN